MNERIKELDKQAKLWAIDNTNFPISSHIPAGYTKKFAELIVAECLEACSRANEIRHFVPPTQQQVVLSCMDEIERTFRS